jgi:hypothetical protein
LLKQNLKEEWACGNLKSRSIECTCTIRCELRKKKICSQFHAWQNNEFDHRGQKSEIGASASVKIRMTMIKSKCGNKTWKRTREKARYFDVNVEIASAGHLHDVRDHQNT